MASLETLKALEHLRGGLQSIEENAKLARDCYLTGYAHSMGEVVSKLITDELDLVTDDFTKHYLVTALWSSNGDDGEPLDAKWDITDFSVKSLIRAEQDCAVFQRLGRKALAQAYEKETGYDEEQAGHDFWLTRNGHGAGFWDRGLGECGDKLTKLAKLFGEEYIFECDKHQVKPYVFLGM